MIWNIRHDTVREYVHAYQSGHFSVEEQAAFLKAIFSAAFWQPGLPLIIDYCALEMEKISSVNVEAVRQIITLLEDRLGSGRLALLCDDDEQFGIGRQFQSAVSMHIKRDVKVFRDQDAAIDWVTTSEPTDSV
jgi:hypothetical protein